MWVLGLLVLVVGGDVVGGGGGGGGSWMRENGWKGLMSGVR